MNPKNKYKKTIVPLSPIDHLFSKIRGDILIPKPPTRAIIPSQISLLIFLQNSRCSHGREITTKTWKMVKVCRKSPVRSEDEWYFTPKTPKRAIQPTPILKQHRKRTHIFSSKVLSKLVSFLDFFTEFTILISENHKNWKLRKFCQKNNWKNYDVL